MNDEPELTYDFDVILGKTILSFEHSEDQNSVLIINFTDGTRAKLVSYSDDPYVWTDIFIEKE